MEGLDRDELDAWEERYNALTCLVPPFPRLDKLPESELKLWRHRFDSFYKRVELVGDLYRAGVVLLMGSDGGGRPGPIDDLGHGIELHVKAGVPPLQAIASATGPRGEVDPHRQRHRQSGERQRGGCDRRRWRPRPGHHRDVAG